MKKSILLIGLLMWTFCFHNLLLVGQGEKSTRFTERAFEFEGDYIQGFQHLEDNDEYIRFYRNNEDLTYYSIDSNQYKIKKGIGLLYEDGHRIEFGWHKAGGLMNIYNNEIVSYVQHYNYVEPTKIVLTLHRIEDRQASAIDSFTIESGYATLFDVHNNKNILMHNEWMGAGNGFALLNKKLEFLGNYQPFGTKGSYGLAAIASDDRLASIVVCSNQDPSIVKMATMNAEGKVVVEKATDLDSIQFRPNNAFKIGKYTIAFGADWSREKSVLAVFNEKAELLWIKDMHLSTRLGPIGIRDNHQMVFMHATTQQDRFLNCIDLETGTVLWKRTFLEYYEEQQIEFKNKDFKMQGQHRCIDIIFSHGLIHMLLVSYYNGSNPRVSMVGYSTLCNGQLVSLDLDGNCISTERIFYKSSSMPDSPYDQSRMMFSNRIIQSHE